MFDFGAYLDDVFRGVVQRWGDAIQAFGGETSSALTELVTSFPTGAALLRFQYRVFVAAEALLNSLLNAVAPTLVDAAIAQFPLPDSWKWSVLTKQSAVIQVLQWIAQATREISSPTGLYSVTLITWLDSRMSLLKFFRGPLEWFWKRIAKRTIELIVRIIMVAYTVFAVLIIIALVVSLGKLVSSGTWPETLQQKTPRKKVRTISEGTIRRRTPGGAQP